MSFGCHWRTEFPYGELTPLCGNPELVHVDRLADCDGALPLCAEHLISYIEWYGKDFTYMKIAHAETPWEVKYPNA